MGSKSSKKGAKKVNPHGKLLKSTKRQTNKETYFGSGRVKELAPARYYIGHTYSRKEEMIIFITITRKHINGNISFVIFGILDKNGWIKKVQYDFNISCQDFDGFLRTTNMVDFEDFEALEHLIYAAEIESRKAGRLPKDYWLAEKILASDKVVNLGQRHRLLGTFQTPDGSELSDLNERYINSHLGPEYACYEPERIENWNRNQWEAFIKELPVIGSAPDVALLRRNMFSPLIFLFEKTELPLLAMHPKTATFLAAFSKQQPCFIKEAAQLPTHEATEYTENPPIRVVSPTGVPKQEEIPVFDYQPNEEEHFLQTSLDADLQIENSKSDHLLTIKRIRKAISKYPENPFFRNLLYVAYRGADESYTAEKIAIENHKAQPDNVYFTLIYLVELESHSRSTRLKRFFKKGYLYEDHFGQHLAVAGKNFFLYYQILAGFLALELDLAGFWQLYYFLTLLPGYDQYIDTRAWPPYQLITAYVMGQKLSSASKSDLKRRLDQLLEAPADTGY